MPRTTGRRPARQAVEMRIADITIGKRHRKEMGDIAGLASSIREHGLLQPVVVRPDGALIAGERRLTACKQLGWTTVRVVDIEHLVFGEQAENIDRKDFTPEERVDIGEAVERLLGERRGRPVKGGKISTFSETGKTRDIAARKAGFRNSKTYEQAKAVRDAAREAPAQHGKALADMNRTGRVHGPFKRVKIANQAAIIRREPPPLPGQGPYRVIVADPPWPYEVRSEDPSHRAVHPYPTMSIDQICAVDVLSIAHEDCILWLWTTNHHIMREAPKVLDAWGFTEKTILTWDKDHMGAGDWLRGITEQCVMAVRGKPVVQLTNQTTLLRAKKHAHSQKPREFYEMVEKLCPAPRYAELFSRKHRER